MSKPTRSKRPPSPPWKLGKIHNTLNLGTANTKRGRRTTRSNHHIQLENSATLAKDLLELATQMRQGEQLEAKDCYCRWRSMEEFVNLSTSELMRKVVPRMSLPDDYQELFPKLYERSSKMAEKTYSQDHHRFDPHLCACLLYNDDHQEANIGVYEPRDCMFLDTNFPKELHSNYLMRYWKGTGNEPMIVRQGNEENGKNTSGSGSSSSNGDSSGNSNGSNSNGNSSRKSSSSRNRNSSRNSSSSSSSSNSNNNNSNNSNNSNTIGNYPYEWAVLYFRQHLVAAHYNDEMQEVTIYNTAAANFLGEDNAPLLPLYVSQWEEMSTILWPNSNRVHVVHLGVQGANDCGIWTWLLPKIYNNETFQSLCDVTLTKKRSRGRAKEKGLNDFFHQEVLSVLQEYVSAVPEEEEEEEEEEQKEKGKEGKEKEDEKEARTKTSGPTKKKRKMKNKKKPIFQLNDLIRARWLKEDTFYEGQIVKVNVKNVTYDVLYDEDQITEKNVLEKFIKTRIVRVIQSFELPLDWKTVNTGKSHLPWDKSNNTYVSPDGTKSFHSLEHVEHYLSTEVERKKNKDKQEKTKKKKKQQNNNDHGGKNDAFYRCTTCKCLAQQGSHACKM